jgi:hypothetical protein
MEDDMAKFFTLNLVKRKPKSKPIVQILADDYIPQRGVKLQIIGIFEEKWQAALARKVKGSAALCQMDGQNVYLEYRNGTIHYSSEERVMRLFSRLDR